MVSNFFRLLQCFIYIGLGLSAHGQQDESQSATNIIYGNFYVFSINTPDSWTNDKKLAREHGLQALFFAKGDFEKPIKSYMYAMGFDKDDVNKDIDSFVRGDLATFRLKSPDLLFNEIKASVPDDMRDAAFFSFYNMKERYKEEVLYLETDDAIFVIAFAAINKEDYEKYEPVFDLLIDSFQYLGHNPKPYIKKIREKN